ncbi:metal-dependent transcriptional regulator [Gordonia rhizosphera]|uniref:Manganese transport regulator n=1 Tax=Gordonia rhizosphera NBRC 16068 TaxID=1108045 RepID=K6WBZ2_9ACTN|nr:metal-dependent transcriptional regulator [Gordonia rhizosphera]GAB89712.1 putative DtxR family transcriptional regulator [Gordonia rhizosphera NBRC 16068]
MIADPAEQTSSEVPLAELSAVSRDYLKAIWSAGEWSTAKVTTSSLAEQLDVAPSTVSTNLRRLAERGLVIHQPYGGVRLTGSGTSAALAIIRRQRLFETFLVQEMGYGWHEVHDDATALASAASDRLIDYLDDRLGYPTRDPHGDPIPDPDGAVAPMTLISLSTCTTGDRGVITRIDDSDPAMLEYFDRVDLTLDQLVTVGATRPFAGTMSVSTEDGPTDIVLGDVAARSIWITRCDRT